MQDLSRFATNRTLVTHDKVMEQAFFDKVNTLCAACPASWESGDRTPQHNASVGGAPESYHTKGLALDLIYDSFNELLSAAYMAITLKFWGIEVDLTNNHLHVDGRPESEQWRVVHFLNGKTAINKDLIIYLTCREKSVKILPTT